MPHIAPGTLRALRGRVAEVEDLRRPAVDVLRVRAAQARTDLDFDPGPRSCERRRSEPHEMHQYECAIYEVTGLVCLRSTVRTFD